MGSATTHAVERQRRRLLVQFARISEAPLMLLGFVWLVLLVVELTRGLDPVLERIGVGIWIAFVIDFAVKFAIAPRKLTFVRSEWLSLVALVLPATRLLRAARVLRAARALRGVRLVRLLTSFNRGMRLIRGTLRRRGFGYVLVLSTGVTLLGAAGMFAFENPAAGGELATYGDALWWTAMIVTTMGSQYWPVTAEGRVLCLALALYGFAILGYVTAALASVFIGQEAEHRGGAVASTRDVERVELAIRDLGDAVQRLQALPR
jgi:voltage-gated potassium channel